MVNKLGGITKLWIHDGRLCDPADFSVDMNNVFPAICMARAAFLRRWIEFGPYRRHPQPYLFFEGPNDDWVYVKDWVRNEQGRTQILILKKEKLAQPERCILSVLDAYKRCESLWQNYEAARISHFEESLFGFEQHFKSNLHPIGSKKM